MIYGHGIDIIEIDRIQKSIKNTKRFKEKIFTQKEIEYCESQKNPFPSFAGRFAVKEAFLKALGTGLREGIKWLDIEILNDEKGKPYLKLSGKLKEMIDKKGSHNIHISISHTENYAVGSVIIEVN
jgi:holo-[acyl-carrier protein] synthase